MNPLPDDQQLLSELGVGVVVFDRAGRVIESNGRARELIGLAPGFAGDIYAYDRIDELFDDRERPIGVDQLPLVRAIQDGEAMPGRVVGFRVKGAGPDVVWLLMGAHPLHDDATGDVERVLCTFVDVTAERAAHRAVAESERRFRLLAENAADMIFRARIVPERRFEYVNPAVQTMLGYAPEDFYADFTLARRLTHPDDRAAAEVTFLAMVQNPSSDAAPLVTRMTRRDGTCVWVEFRIVAIVEGREVVAFEGIVRDVSSMKAKEADLSHRASHDPLTGMPNRVVLLDSLDRALAAARASGGDRDRRAVAVLYVDLDRFKTVNDNLGHDAGDRVLTTVGERMAEVMRPSDSVARLGGDEFAAVLPGLHSVSEAMLVAHRLLEAVRVPVPLDEGDLVTTASVGIAYTSDGAEAPAELLRRADLAMYRAKDEGRARVASYDHRDTGTGPDDGHG